uniref:Lysozyme g n=1 Tax=Electrophorus electricus TaxID=8005 RepID=A0AAY5EKR7_ELEEL
MATQVILFMSVITCVFGDIMNIDMTGASVQIALQDRLKVTYKTMPNPSLRVGSFLQTDGPGRAGIISRESRAGAVLVNGWGDCSNAFGLMQVNKCYHGACSEEHLTQDIEILINSIKKFPRRGVLTYNAPVGDVLTYERMHIGTPGNYYANDMVAGAQFYKCHGY